MGCSLSRRKINPLTWIRPHAILVLQNTQRQVVFSAIHPPAIGPIIQINYGSTGQGFHSLHTNDRPKQWGKTIDRDSLSTLFGMKKVSKDSTSNLSEFPCYRIKYCDFTTLTASGALPPNPERRRNAKNCPVLCANPQAILNTRKNKLASWRTLARPNISLSGPRKSGPNADIHHL